MPTFLRSDTVRHLRLGKRRPKLRKWRRPRGRHSKIRRHRFGYPVAPTVGYGTPKSEAGKVNGLRPVLVHNVAELEALDKNSIAIIAKVGAKKKMEMLKKAEEKKIKIMNAGGKK